MAKKTVEAAAAAKAKKQKTILIAGGVLLLGLGAIQGPKMLGGGGAAEATPATTPTTEVATGTPATPTTPTPTTTTSFRPAGMVAGVALPGATVVKVSTDQLASFTLFEVKDPFVQQAGDESGDSETGTATAPTTNPTTPAPTASGSPSGASGSLPPASPPLVYATINVDGKPQQAKVKQEFPASEPLFVLVSVGKKQVKIGVAGGSFDNGETITLKLGKKLTLVNTATNVRYELKLVYTGSAPEAIEGFSADKTQPPTGNAATASSTVSVAPAATP